VSSISNVLYFLTLPLITVLSVIYISKGMSKSLGCALYIRCALSIEKYGTNTMYIIKIAFTLLLLRPVDDLRMKQREYGTINMFATNYVCFLCVRFTLL
jgi:hypothetical protein